MKLLAEELNIVSGFVPVNLATAGATGDWCSLKLYRRATVVLFKGAGGDSEPVTIAMKQATAIAGTGSKVLNFTRYDYKANSDLTLVGPYTKATQTASDTVKILGPNGGSETIVLLGFNAEDLDVENGFDCIQVSVPDTMNQSVLASAFYVLSGPRYAPPLSAIAD